MRSRGILGSRALALPLRLARRLAGRWKRQLLSEAYYSISVTDPTNRKRVGWPSLYDDGHPMIARRHHWTVTDRYPDKMETVPLILYNETTGAYKDVHMFSYSPRSRDTDVKCDLHPRWDRTETRVAVDTCEAGNRQVRIVDVSDIVAQ